MKGKASEIMTRPVVAATPQASGRDVASLLLASGFSGMPVADGDGKVMGIITEIDLLHAVRQGMPLEKVVAADIMTANPITVDVETPVEEIIGILDDKRIIRVPVVKEGKLVGLISRSDILRALLQPEFVTFK